MDTIERIIESAEEVHEHLGVGHTESTYHSALERELSNQHIPFVSEGTIPIFYKGSPVGRRRPDMFVETDDGTIIVELKAGSKTGEEQLLDYQSILEDDSNFNITGGILIRFNDELEYVKS
jgi:GxxExxY protein